MRKRKHTLCAIEALEAGRRVLCEKPVALSNGKANPIGALDIIGTYVQGVHANVREISVPQQIEDIKRAIKILSELI